MAKLKITVEVEEEECGAVSEYEYPEYRLHQEHEQEQQQQQQQRQRTWHGEQSTSIGARPSRPETSFQHETRLHTPGVYASPHIYPTAYPAMLRSSPQHAVKPPQSLSPQQKILKSIFATRLEELKDELMQ